MCFLFAQPKAAAAAAAAAAAVPTACQLGQPTCRVAPQVQTALKADASSTAAQVLAKAEARGWKQLVAKPVSVRRRERERERARPEGRETPRSRRNGQAGPDQAK